MVACIMSSVNKTFFFSNVLDETKIGSLYKIVLISKNAKNQYLLYFFVKSLNICVQNITESYAKCKIEVLKVPKSDYN